MINEKITQQRWYKKVTAWLWGNRSGIVGVRTRLQE